MKCRSGLKLACLFILLSMYSLIACSKQTGEPLNECGVFIGVNPEDADILLNYKVVVIDAVYYSKAEIIDFQHNGIEVYSYLNIGSIETFRESYPAYRHLVLGEYKNWPGEYWVDVSQTAWQEYIAEEARALREKNCKFSHEKTGETINETCKSKRAG